MFGEWLARIAFVHEGISTYRDDRENSSRDKRFSKGSNLIVNTNENEKSEQCPLADGNHKIWSCQLFFDRYAAAKKQRLCFGCLKKGCSLESL